MPVTSIAAKLSSNGLQQHMFAEPTVVAEKCSGNGQRCIYDSDCCNDPSYITNCEWYACEWILKP